MGIIFSPTRWERRVWVGTLLAGCTCVYAARTTMPLTAAAVSTELKWSKTDMVNYMYHAYSAMKPTGTLPCDNFRSRAPQNLILRFHSETSETSETSELNSIVKLSLYMYAEFVDFLWFCDICYLSTRIYL